jgi:hypothetical protein
MNHILSRGTPAEERLRTEERASLAATIAPFSSEQGVDMRLRGVTLGLAHKRVT